MDHASFMSDALSRMGEINQDIDGLVKSTIERLDAARQVQATTGSNAASVVKRGGRDEIVHTIHSDVRDTLAHTTDLGHETELVLEANYFIRQFGIDLDNMLNGGSMPGPGGQMRYEQRDRAVLHSGENDPAPMAVASGEMGIRIPLRAEIFGQQEDFNLNANAIINQHRTFNRFQFTVSRQIHLDRALATRTVTRTVKERANQNIERHNGQLLPTLPSANLGQGDPRYYTSAFDGDSGLLRFFGTYGNKRRSKFDRLGALPEWAQIGIKTGSHIFVGMLHQKIREAGVSPGPVQFIGNNKFRTTASVVQSNKVRIVCTDFGVTARLTFFLEGHIYPVGSSSLRLQVHEYQGVDTDIRYHPRAVDFLLRWTDGFVESIMKLMAPAVSLTKNFYIPNSRRVAVDLNAQRFLAYIAVR
ncbi:MAG: hypothetical protein AB2689_05420 [Candidatus Thiodiazotropha taylori]